MPITITISNDGANTKTITVSDALVQKISRRIRDERYLAPDGVTVVDKYKNRVDYLVQENLAILARLDEAYPSIDTQQVLDLKAQIEALQDQLRAVKAGDTIIT